MDQVYFSDFIDLKAAADGYRFSDSNPFAYLGPGLEAFLAKLLRDLGVENAPVIRGKVEEGAYIRGKVYIAEGATVEPTALIDGPTYIGPGAQVRHGAYIRGQVYIGPRAVVGHTTEVKGSLFFDDAKAGHFAYVGDSILGRDTNLGAGTKLANLPFRRQTIRVVDPRTGRPLDTGLKKFGAIMGDHAQTGCNAVLSPGTLMSPKTAVFPAVHYRGSLTEGVFRG
jgi:bifunctional UDP-N-acetylglucosamine pyrophosphorylase/glucosamine-1-phosphate N-acetyltransferase